MVERIAVDRIYDALADDASFEALPAELAAAHGGRSTMIHWTDAGGTTVLGYAGCHTDEQLAVYARDFAARNLWVEASLRTESFNRAVDLETLVPIDQFTRTEFYNDYIRAMGDDTARCLGTMVRNAYGQGVVAIQRGKSQRGFNEAQVEAVDELVPHLRRMLTIRGRMAGMERRLGTITTMLDALPQAAVLVRPDGWIVWSRTPGPNACCRRACCPRHGADICATTGRAQACSQRSRGPAIRAARPPTRCSWRPVRSPPSRRSRTQRGDSWRCCWCRSRRGRRRGCRG